MNDFYFNYSVSKIHPWKEDGFTHLEAFLVLQQAIAKFPGEMFNLNDNGFSITVNEQQYRIKLQE